MKTYTDTLWGRTALAVFWLLFLLPVLPAKAQQGPRPGKAEVWFVPGDDLNVRGKVGRPDYGALFTPGSPWRMGYQHIDVFQLRSPWVLSTSPQEVDQAYAFFAQHHIKVGAVMGTVITDGPGLGIEGFGTAPQTEAYARALKRQGRPLDYILVDEPVTWGHEYHGRNAAGFSLEEVARRTAQSIRLVQKYYPAAKIVLVEVPQALPGGPAELLEFLHDWRDQLGAFPSAVRFDMQWRQNWQADTPGFVRMLAAQHIPYGVIWDGSSPQAADGRQWIGEAQANMRAFHALIKDAPSEDVIQSWSAQPDRDLPESDPTTMTGYLKWYVTTQANRHRPARPAHRP